MLVEAMACGVPVVATSSPGTREIVSVGLDGLLVTGTSRTRWPLRSRGCSRIRSFERRMAAEARRSATRFALPVIAGVYDGVFRKVLA